MVDTYNPPRRQLLKTWRARAIRRCGLVLWGTPTVDGWESIAARERHCAVAQDGSRITCWLGTGATSTPSSNMGAPGYRLWVARCLARALLADARHAGATAAHALRARAEATLGSSPAWLAPLTDALAGLSHASWQRFDVTSLAHTISQQDTFDLAFEDGARPHIRRLILRSPSMRPRPLGLDLCRLPSLTTLPELARWLEVDTDWLQWLIHPAQNWRERNQPHARPASHYRYKLQPKRLGGLRLLEIPKAGLKQVQRRINQGLLQQVPTHEAAHGFVPGRGVASHAAAHVGQTVVIGFDLRDFFPSVSASRIHALWYSLGYPEGVCRALTVLCTHRTHSAVLARMRGDPDDPRHDPACNLDWLGAKRLAAPHLPQGAPTSPALANLCAFALDLRLEGLAWTFGARYSRYADDMVFSGPAALRAQFDALHTWVATIAADEGFALHPGKSRCMPRHGAQRITGVIVNSKVQTPRADFDQLKARLHQCVLHGPTSQNRQGLSDFQGHLLGQIAWVGQFNPTRQAKLMRLFGQIEWPRTSTAESRRSDGAADSATGAEDPAG